jgi:hypothetical protein
MQWPGECGSVILKCRMNQAASHRAEASLNDAGRDLIWSSEGGGRGSVTSFRTIRHSKTGYCNFDPSSRVVADML